MGRLTINLLLVAVSALAAMTDALECYTCDKESSLADCNSRGTQTCAGGNMCGTIFKWIKEFGEPKVQVKKLCVPRQACKSLFSCNGSGQSLFCFHCCDSDNCDFPPLCPDEDYGEPCQNGGTCIGGDTCDCPPGFGGDHCRIACAVSSHGGCDKTCGIGSREVVYDLPCPSSQEKCCQGPCPSGLGGNFSSLGSESSLPSAGKELCRDYPPYRDQV